MLESCKAGAGRSGRAGPHPRCQRCAAHVEQCFCDAVRALSLDTQVIAITHQREAGKPTNTARLILLALSNAQVRIRGRKGEPLGTRGLVVPERRTLVLFPSDEAVELTAEVVAADPRPITLVVPDGTWRQARRVLLREP
ncbi:DTW domain-containing protein, partial [Planctomycetota bacterium]|nr:DTW domain-containing protein [Planctomycetota bacterium]